MRTTVLFHLPERSGPSQSLLPGLRRLAGAGALEVVVPEGRHPDSASPGSVAADYSTFATVTRLPYAALTVPRSARAATALPLGLLPELGCFRRHLRRNGPDLAVIVTSVLPMALAAARLEGVPSIVRVSELFAGSTGGVARSAGMRALIEILRALPDAVICCSEAVAAQFGGRSPNRLETIYPGIDPDHGEGDGPGFRRRHGIEAARPLIAVVGNITRGRGQDLAVRALPEIRARFPDAHLLFAGAPHPRQADVDYARRINELARSLGVLENITFAGFVERVADVYSAAEVVLNPIRVREAFGRVALESLLARCPVVATRTGAIPEVLRDGRDALLVALEDPAGIARAVIRLCADPDLAHGLAEEGRARVLRDFSVERSATDFARLAMEVASGPSAGRGRRCHHDS